MVISYLQLHVKLSMQNKLVELCTQLEAQEEFKETATGGARTLSELTGSAVGPASEERKKQQKLNARTKMLCGQLAPLLDRTGRLMADMAPHFASATYAPEVQGEVEQVQFPRMGAVDLRFLTREEEEKDKFAPVECQVPLMPNPADISSLLPYTERWQGQTQNATSMQGIVGNAMQEVNTELGLGPEPVPILAATRIRGHAGIEPGAAAVQTRIPAAAAVSAPGVLQKVTAEYGMQTEGEAIVGEKSAK